jgi:zinc protease
MGVDTDLPKLVEEHSIATGVKCLLYRTSDNPTVAIHGSIRAGNASEPRGLQGVAELSTRLLIRGSRKMKHDMISESLESVGAAISFRNTTDAISFQARMTTPWMERVLNILSECLTRPRFDQRDVDKEKEELLTDIRIRDDDPTRRGIRELLQLVYPKNHPYSRDKFGSTESVKKIERSDLLDFYEEHGLKAPVILAFAGQFKPETVLKWSGRTVGERDEDLAVKQTPDAKSNPSKKEIVMPHKSQTEIMMGSLAVARLDPDFEPLNLLNAILGELGFMGRLGARVRDKEGLAYSCTSFLNAGLQAGNWTALAGVNPKNVDKAKKLMEEEIKRIIDEPVTDQELVDAKENQTGSALMELESTEGIARTSHNLIHFGLGLDYFAKRKQLYKKINAENLQEMAGKYLQPSRTSIVIAGPRASGESGSKP